jgi:HAD superfamily hydrolase (TIGR01549 family)
MALRAVLFDLDDTLYDHSHAIGAALREVAALAPALLKHGSQALFAEYDKALDDVHQRVLAGQLTFDQARTLRYERLLAWCGDDASDPHQLARIQVAAYRRNERLVKHALPLLQALRDFGLKLGIVTNSVRDEQQAKLDRLGVASYFDDLTVSADHNIAKPDPRLFTVALDALQVDASEAVFVGDRVPIDVRGAQAAGMRAVWFDRGWRDEGGTLDAAVARITTLEPAVALPILLG